MAFGRGRRSFKRRSFKRRGSYRRRGRVGRRRNRPMRVGFRM